jgi:Flp pilus assembly protein TadD
VLTKAGEAYGADDAEHKEFFAGMMELARVLADRAFTGDAQAAKELRQMYRHQRHNQELIAMLMFAEMALDNIDDAERLADALAALSPQDHAAHFNLAQVYWRAGRRADADRHFDVAYELATDDDERRDVVELRRYLQEWK